MPSFIRNTGFLAIGFGLGIGSLDLAAAGLAMIVFYNAELRV